MPRGYTIGRRHPLFWQRSRDALIETWAKQTLRRLHGENPDEEHAYRGGRRSRYELASLARMHYLRISSF